MKSATQDDISRYAKALPENYATMCRVLHKAIDVALPKAASKIWHSMPVWFIGENPVVGYKASPSHVTLLFWSGQLFGDPALKPVGKFKAAKIQFTDASQIDLKALRRWLKQCGKEIWDYQGYFRAQKALQKRGKT